jgi:hypothetical protein
MNYMLLCRNSLQPCQVEKIMVRLFMLVYLLRQFQGLSQHHSVGCIALLRLSHESVHLTDSILEVCGSTLLHDLANLHQVLKAAENNRGVGVDYGTGVCPVSRRIILRVISTLALYDMKRAKDGAISGRDILHQLAIAPVDDLRLQKDVVQSAEKLFRICECAYDFAFFSPELVTDLLNNHHSEFELLFECVISGYSQLSFNTDVDDICYQVRSICLCHLCTIL